MDAHGAADVERMGTEFVVNPGVIPLAEQVEIEIGKDASETIGIVELGDVPVRTGHSEAVRRHLLFVPEHCFVDAGRMPLRHLDGRMIGARNGNGRGGGKDRADDEPAALHVRSEHRERIGVPRAGQRVQEGNRGRAHGSASAPGGADATATSVVTGVSHARRMASSGRSPGPPRDVTPA